MTQPAIALPRLITASDELFIYDRNFRIRRSFRSSYLKHCHEISRLDRHLYLTSTGQGQFLHGYS